MPTEVFVAVGLIAGGLLVLVAIRLAARGRSAELIQRAFPSSHSEEAPQTMVGIAANLMPNNTISACDRDFPYEAPAIRETYVPNRPPSEAPLKELNS